MKKLVLFFLSFATLVSCGQKKTEVQYFERPVKTIVVESLSTVVRTFTGVTSAKDESELGFKMGGEIVKMNVEDGQHVKKGELIAEVDSHDYKNQFDAAKTAYLNAQSLIERYERLYKKEAISQQDYEMSQTNFVQAKSVYENARKLLADTKLYAPFNGIIEKRYANKFQRVQPFQAVVKLINPKELEVNFTLPVNMLESIDNNDMTLSVEFDNYKGINFNMKIYKQVNSSPDGSGVPMTLLIDDKRFSYEKYNIKSGFSCTVTVTINKTNTANDIIIPLSAVYFNDSTNSKTVWIYDAKTSTVSSRNVVLGNVFGADQVIVLKGLAPGEVIASAGVSQLSEGQKVKLIK